MGETTAAIAQARPAENFLCLEVFNAGVGSLLSRIEDLSLANIRIISHDAVEVLKHMIATPITGRGSYLFPRPLAQDPTPQTAFDPS